MGFSVSGAAAIVFVGSFIAFGMWFTASANSFEHVSEAESDRADGVLAQQNTRVNVTSATWDGDLVTVNVENAGATQLRLSTTDLLVGGEYWTGWEGDATVAGEGDTDLWLSGETASITVDPASRPGRVKVVTASGVSDVAEVI